MEFSCFRDQARRILRAWIWLTCMALSLGFLIIWIMTPTDMYWHHWWKFFAKAKSKYLGKQGLIVMIYTSPILLIATLGSVYLHVGNKSHHGVIQKQRKVRKDSLAPRKRHVIVKSPFGFVSITEVFFFAMFIALLVWSFAMHLHDSLNRVTPQEQAWRKENHMWETKLYYTSLMLGVVGEIGLVFLFFPVTRRSSVLPLFGLSFEGSIKYHKWIGHIIMVLFSAHGLGYVIYWLITDNISQGGRWQKAGVANVPGELSLLAGAAMWATTHLSTREKSFELFFYTHHLYILFMVFYVFHVSFTHACHALAGFYLFLIDRYVRFLQSQNQAPLVAAQILPCQTVELSFSKCPNLSYHPSSIMFINVPAISRWQWHPFTINSNCNLEPDYMSIVVKSEGSWTKALCQILSSSSSLDHLKVSVEGPYGPATTDFLRHDMLVMVSGGSGIAPFMSIIRELVFTRTTLKWKTPRVSLICAFKHSSELSMLDLLLPVSNSSELSALQLQIDAYVTREKEPGAQHRKQLRTVWFKPRESDVPIHDRLGSSSWLWLGAIISSSFIIFLLLIGIITTCYTYPIDHDTFTVLSLSLSSVLNMLVISISIIVTASAAAFWNRKKNAEEARRIQIIKNPRPDEFTQADAESLPSVAVIQATSVHYGGRPDLRRLLGDCQGSSTGVLVCGPQGMRHEVATICSSSKTPNLYLECISFSW